MSCFRVRKRESQLSNHAKESSAQDLSAHQSERSNKGAGSPTGLSHEREQSAAKKSSNNGAPRSRETSASHHLIIGAGISGSGQTAAPTAVKVETIEASGSASPELHEDKSGLRTRQKVRLNLPESEVVALYAMGDTSAPDSARGPYFGSWVLQGKRGGMEDACMVVHPIATGLHACRDPVRDVVPAPLGGEYTAELERNPSAPSPIDEAPGPSSRAPGEGEDAELSYFGVFDGHGGDWASKYCAKVMHVHFANRLRKVLVEGAPRCLETYSPEAFAALLGEDAGRTSNGEMEALLSRHTSERLQMSDEGTAGVGRPDKSAAETHAQEANGVSAAPGDSKGAGDEEDPMRISVLERPLYVPRLDVFDVKLARALQPWMICEALRMAFLTTHIGFRQQTAVELVGTTSVVMVVTRTHLFIANTGDSRGVLKRGGRVLPLTCDQKPTREDESKRVQDAGGRIYMTDGFRVEGILGMTRAIGDVALEGAGLTPEPEMTVLERREEDEVAVLASDGLWEVMTNEGAVETACKAITMVSRKGRPRNFACRHAAKVLAHHALKMGSSDNISVVVVDLKSPDHKW